MDRATQEAMDGSAATSWLTLRQVKVAGKFGWTNPDAAYGANLAPEMVVANIDWQCGPIQEVGINGASIEDVIDLLVARLRGFQDGPFKCRENALAITKLEEAQLWLFARTIARQRQGVEGTNRPHVAP